MTQLRKLADMMTSEEKGYLSKVTKSINYHLNKYSLNRMTQRHITKEMLRDTINNGQIIEYNLSDNRTHRVLLRGTKAYQEQACCVVVDITDKTIVTAYKNNIEDTHKTLNGWEYTFTGNVIKFIRNNH